MFSNRFNTQNDPLLEAVKGAMQDGDLRRQAVALVNEAFGVYNRNAVIRENLAAYDAALEEAYKCMKEGEKKDEPKLDMKAREKAKSDYSKMREKMVGKGKDLETTRKIVGEAKKLADKDYDKDGKVESPKDEVWGSRFRAAKMAGKMEEEQIDELKQSTVLSYANKVSKQKFDKKVEPGHKDRYAAYTGDKESDKKSTRLSYRTNAFRNLALNKAHNDKPGKRYPEHKLKTGDMPLSHSGGSQKARVLATKEEVDYSAPDRAAVTRDNRPSTPAQTNAATSGPSAADRAALASKISTMKEAAYSAKSARAGKDIGKPGKMFSKIASKAGKKYGSEERGKAVAGAILKRIRAKHMKEADMSSGTDVTSAFPKNPKNWQETPEVTMDAAREARKSLEGSKGEIKKDSKYPGL